MNTIHLTKRRHGWIWLLCLSWSLTAQPPSIPIPYRLTLADAERALLARNLLVAVNREQLAATEAQKLIASYRPNPTIQLGGEQITITSPVEGAAPRFFSTNSDAGANSVYTFLYSQLFERGGKRQLRTQQAEANVLAARAQIRDTFRQQVFQLRSAFTIALAAKLRADLARSLLADFDRTIELTQKRSDNGDLAPVELYRVRSARLPYEQGILQGESAYQQACLDILNLLNGRRNELTFTPEAPKDARFPLLVDGALSTSPVVTPVEELIAQALSARPDLEVARQTYRGAERGTRLAEAQRKRDITVGVEFQRVGNDNSAGVIANLPLFLYNNQKAGIAQAAALERAANLSVRQTETQIRTDVEKATAYCAISRRNLEIFTQENLEQVRKLRDVARFSFTEGATSLLEFLDAQRTFNTTISAYQDAQADYQGCLWNLEQATGANLP